MSAERYTRLLGVRCDEDDDCDEVLRGDFLVAADSTRADWFGYALDDAATRGWTVLGRDHPETALAFCPEHSASVPVGPTKEDQ